MIESGKVILKELAEKYHLTPRKARKLLRKAGMPKQNYFWLWKFGSKTVERVELILQDFRYGNTYLHP